MKHTKVDRSLCALLAIGVLVLASPLAGCGSSQLIVTDTTTIDIGGTLRPPPPPPPPPESKRVVVTQDAIMINDKILFDVDKATIKEESHGLLNEIVGVIKANPHIKKLSIEGHIGGDDSEKHNHKLSANRASAVKQYLIDNGIADSMLDSKGIGETKPIADNETDVGEENNGRIMFIIAEQDKIEKAYDIDPKTGKNHEVKKEVAQ